MENYGDPEMEDLQALRDFVEITIDGIARFKKEPLGRAGSVSSDQTKSAQVGPGQVGNLPHKAYRVHTSVLSELPALPVR